MKQYLELLNHILENGKQSPDRTGTGTKSVFGYQMRFDLNKGFPLLTTKKLHLKSIIHELLWILSGSTNIKYLNDNGVTIWDEWANEYGNLGPVYGEQWRGFGDSYEQGVDQISELIKNLKEKPYSRRHVVSAWNPVYLPNESISPRENVNQGRMALAPCHCLFQFHVDTDKNLSCQLYQRSADSFLGIPYNIASYALLTYMIAQQCDLNVGDFIWTGGDVHLYLNHLEQAKLQLTREPFNLPQIKINKANSIFDYKFEDFELLNYQSHPHIKAEVSI